MNCCQCRGIEELFSQEYVANELKRYRKRGPDQTTRLLIEAIEGAGIEGLSLLDIGGGVGAIPHKLLEAGVEQATGVEASSAYISAARSEAQRLGYGEKIHHHHGNFVDLAREIAPADIVTLDRVICCYPDMEDLVELSTAKARKLYGLVYPRDAWWMKLAMTLLNLGFRMQRNPYRGFTHPSHAVEKIIRQSGFELRFYRRTLVWQVALYARLLG